MIYSYTLFRVAFCVSLMMRVNMSYENSSTLGMESVKLIAVVVRDMHVWCCTFCVFGWENNVNDTVLD